MGKRRDNSGHNTLFDSVRCQRFDSSNGTNEFEFTSDDYYSSLIVMDLQWITGFIWR